MAVTAPVPLNNRQLNLMDTIKRLDPKGNVAYIAEVLNQANNIIPDVVYKEGNLPEGDEQTIRNGLPEVYWRQKNRGVPPSKSTVVQVTETCGEMGAMSKIDQSILELNGNSAAFRASEEKPFIESMGQAFTKTLFYGDARVKAEGFTGFAARYSTLDESQSANAVNVIDCGGTVEEGKTSKLTSIYLVGWGQDTVYCPYPKGSKVGLDVNDLGLIPTLDDLGHEYMAYVTMYRQKVGLMVKDWRYVVRLANIDVSELSTGKGIGEADIRKANSTNLILKLQEALSLIPAGGNPRLSLYLNRQALMGLNVLSERMGSNVMQWHQINDQFGGTRDGTSLATFMGVPLKRVDALINGEAQVV